MKAVVHVLRAVLHMSDKITFKMIQPLDFYSVQCFCLAQLKHLQQENAHFHTFSLCKYRISLQCMALIKSR